MQPDTDLVWPGSTEVPDPEIPVISVIDLGIVRDVDWHGDTLVVTVTPTYSGCPATASSTSRSRRSCATEGHRARSAEAPALAALDHRLDRREGREKLRAYGIAPPVEGTAAEGARRPRSALRASRRPSPARAAGRPTPSGQPVRLHPLQGAWRCRDCLEPFDYFKCI
jgi:ring-1,2-phenylacetyl-CoA epoxidase subunit PaaD